MYKVVIEIYGLGNNLHEKPQPRCDADTWAIIIAISLLRIVTLMNGYNCMSIALKFFQRVVFNS